MTSTSSLKLLLALSLSAAVAQAAPIFKIAGNTSMATAQNLDGAFDLSFSSDIGDYTTNTSTTIAHATVTGANGLATGNAGASDWYSFTAGANKTVILDIDYGMFDVDSWLNVYQGASLIAQVDDASTSYGQGGSAHPYDAYYQFTSSVAGLYYVQVLRYPNSPFGSGQDYQLHVSVGDHAAVSAPDSATTAGLIGLGLVGMLAMRRRRTA